MAQEAQEREVSLSSNCIGELEHHIHKVFASVRIPGEDFVYNSSSDLFSILEDYCHDQANGLKPPLLILGESGVGKSALLSNWLEKKHRNALRSRSSVDEFIFWHAVGCSRQSTNVNNLIRRLIVDLTNRFELSMRDVPVHQERLSWELPRFLELASKRGKIIVVIDGVNRLMSDEDNEASLAWLPLELPSNVRFVLSATVPSEGLESTLMDKSATNATSDTSREAVASESSPSNIPSIAVANETPAPRKKGRILSELERRQWQILRLRPLDKVQCRNLITSFVQKTVQSEVSSLATGPFLTALSKASEYSAQEVVPGFLLFECHISALLSHPQGGTPLFIRLFLRCAYLVCSRGFSLWQIWDDWLQADSVPALFGRIMECLERGHTKSSKMTQFSIDRTCQEGGLAALRKLYPWHPAFQGKSDEGADTFAAMDYAQVAGDKGGRTSSTILAASRATGQAGPALSNSVLQSLGDQQWLSAADQAEAKFEAARKKVIL